MGYSWKKCIFISIAGAALFAVVALLYFRPRGPTRFLPSDATEIQEDHWEDGGFGSDYTYRLKAKIAREGYPEFVKSLGLERTYSKDKHANLDITFMPTSQLAWWDPPESLEGAHFQTFGKDGFWIEAFKVAAYKDGYVYYFSMSQ